MNEELQNTVNDILVRAIESFNSGADWLAGEIPDVVEQLLLWHFVESILVFFVMTMSLMAIVAVDVITKKFIDENENNNKDDALLKWWAANVAVFPFILLVYFTVINMNWLKIWIAPKLYLLEYAADLIK